MKSRKPDKQRVKRYTVVLSECEMRRLTCYAAAAGIDRPTALHRLVSQSLRQATEGVSPDVHEAVNQLGLFDSVQIDIFNNTHKAN